MRKKYSIGILFCTVILCAIYTMSYHMYEKQYSSDKEGTTEALEAKVVSSGNRCNASGYYLKEEDGYVYVYLADKKTLYEATSIRTKQLPDPLRQEIKKGKIMQDEKELYNFLENYSS